MDDDVGSGIVLDKSFSLHLERSSRETSLANNLDECFPSENGEHKKFLAKENYFKHDFITTHVFTFTSFPLCR